MRMKMWCLSIRIKRNDQLHGKPLHRILIEFLIEAKIAGATVWTGVDGFGKRRRSTIHLEGITINMPMVIEVIEEQSKLEPLLPQIKRMVNDNGIVTLHEVEVF
jgi:PII-like signaling protein